MLLEYGGKTIKIIIFVAFLTSSPEKAAVTLYFGRILTRLGVVDVPSFLVESLTSSQLLLFVRNNQVKKIVEKRLYPRT